MQIHENAAITFRGTKYGKTEIERLSAVLESNIAIRKYKKDSVVAISMNRSHWIIIAMYTLHRLGIPYTIISAILPQKRVDSMLETAGVSMVISDDETALRFQNYDVISVNNITDTILRMNNCESELMYLAFTSGSTGKPKAVEILSSGFEIFSQAFIETGTFNGASTICCMSDFGFDIIYGESLIPLIVGMNIIVAGENDISSVTGRINFIKQNKADFIQCTPTALQMMKVFDEEMSFLDGIKTILLGGEVLPAALLHALSEHSSLRIYNFYGPTEATVWATYSELSGKSRVDIGRPLTNTDVYILNEKLEELPEGEEGEICISGPSIAKGYYGDADATQKSFIDWHDKRIYLTGDLGFISEGLLYCEGRKDFQVKVHGFRIETEEIEGNFCKIDGIEAAVATTYETEYGPEIVCFYLGNAKLEEKFIRHKLSLSLPEYMIPSAIVYVDDFMYTSSGKVDRKAMVKTLLSKEQQPTENKPDRSLADSLKEEIIGLLKQKTFAQLDNVLSEDRLDSLGINSVAYVSMIVELEEKYDFEFEDEYLNPDAFDTFGDLVNYVCGFIQK